VKVTEALQKRISTRDFLTTPVDRETVERILEIAKYAPSGGNLQPWKVYVVMDAARDELVDRIQARIAETPRGEGTQYHIYPPELTDPYRSRRFKCGEDMYALLQIPREDKGARIRRLMENYTFFGAPVGLFFTIDRQMQEGQWSDLGMFIQSVMLVACEFGLATCAQEAWANWHKTVGEFLAIPTNEMLFCGMALGYANPDHPVNTLRTDRAPLDAFVVFKA